MGKIDSEGTFLGTIAESGLNLTNENKYPQWVARLAATKKYVSDLEGMKHFGLEEPGYVDWTSFEEDITSFQCLFKSAEDFSDATKLLSYDQLQLATGWDGTSFDALSDGSLVGKEILFRVQNDSYVNKSGKTIEGLKVTWIDNVSASPERALKVLAVDEVKNLSAKLKAGIGAMKKPAAAKPAAKPAKPVAAGATKPAAAPTSATAAPSAATTSGATPASAAPAAASTSAPSTPASAPAKSVKGPPKAKGKAATPPPPPPAEETDSSAGLPTESSQEDAWTYLCENAAQNDDAAIEDAWLSACGEVFEGRAGGEASATPADWAKIRNIVIKDLAL